MCVCVCVNKHRDLEDLFGQDEKEKENANFPVDYRYNNH